MGQEFLLIPIEVDFPCYFQQSSNYFFKYNIGRPKLYFKFFWSCTKLNHLILVNIIYLLAYSESLAHSLTFSLTYLFIH